MTLDPFVESIFGNCHICISLYLFVQSGYPFVKSILDNIHVCFSFVQSALYVIQSALYCMYKVLLSVYSLSKAYSNNTCIHIVLSCILGVFKLLLYAKDVWQ